MNERHANSVPKEFLEVAQLHAEVRASLIHHEVMNAVAGLGAALAVARRRMPADADELEPALNAMSDRLRALETSLAPWGQPVARSPSGPGSLETALRRAAEWASVDVPISVDDAASTTAEPARLDLLCFLLVGRPGLERVHLSGASVEILGEPLPPATRLVAHRLAKELGASFSPGPPLRLEFAPA